MGYCTPDSTVPQILGCGLIRTKLWSLWPAASLGRLSQCNTTLIQTAKHVSDCPFYVCASLANLQQQCLLPCTRNVYSYLGNVTESTI